MAGWVEPERCMLAAERTVSSVRIKHANAGACMPVRQQLAARLELDTNSRVLMRRSLQGPQSKGPAAGGAAVLGWAVLQSMQKAAAATGWKVLLSQARWAAVQLRQGLGTGQAAHLCSIRRVGRSASRLARPWRSAAAGAAFSLSRRRHVQHALEA